MPSLEHALKQLRLSGHPGFQEVRKKQAIEDGLSHVEFLAMLIRTSAHRALRALRDNRLTVLGGGNGWAVKQPRKRPLDC